MKDFLIRLLVFVAPLVVLGGPPILALRLAEESFTTIDEPIELKEKYLVGYAYNVKNYRYLKWKEVTSQEPVTIMATGSSRILQFREHMFSSSFYNAGYTLSNMGEFLPFLKTIPENKRPKVLLINLDQWMFNAAWDPMIEIPGPKEWSHDFEGNASPPTLASVWVDLLEGKYTYLSLWAARNDRSIHRIGLNAVVNNKGFRNDGSMLYGEQIEKLGKNDPTALDYGFSDTLERIKTGTRMFETGSTVNPVALQKLSEILGYCSENHMQVIAILPPFADGVMAKLNQGRHPYMHDIFRDALPIFEKYSFEFWDMTDLSTFGSNDTEMIDGFHGGEVAYLKMLVFMIENGSALGDHTDLRQLRSDLEKRTNNYLVYDD